MNKPYILLALFFIFVPLIGCAKQGQHYTLLSGEKRKYYQVLNNSDSVGMVNCITSAIKERYETSKDRKVNVVGCRIRRDRVSPETQATVDAVFTITDTGQTKKYSLFFKLCKEGDGGWKQKEMDVGE